MHEILIKKIKNALKSENPLDNVKDVVAQYEEIYRLVLWRNKVLISGKYNKKMKTETDEINEKILKSGFYCETADEQIMREIKDYFKNI